MCKLLGKMRTKTRNRSKIGCLFKIRAPKWRSKWLIANEKLSDKSKEWEMSSKSKWLGRNLKMKARTSTLWKDLGRRPRQ
jgi:hypothetical protein